MPSPSFPKNQLESEPSNVKVFAGHYTSMTTMMTTDREIINARKLFSDLPTLDTQRLILRKMTLADAESVYAYARDPLVSRYTVWGRHLSLGDARDFLHGVVSNYENGIPENWGIVFKENGAFIGTCGYFIWDIENRCAEIQYALSRAYSGRGLMTEAVCRVIRFGFEEMGLNRIAAHCMPGNIASERVMQKAGMHFEGVMREALYAKGKFHDLKSYALLRGDSAVSHKYPDV
jgi:ribosomal-protein-alanine N-acetyltransferase